MTTADALIDRFIGEASDLDTLFKEYGGVDKKGDQYSFKGTATGERFGQAAKKLGYSVTYKDLSGKDTDRPTRYVVVK